jgi:hypothetical protein
MNQRPEASRAIGKRLLFGLALPLVFQAFAVAIFAWLGVTRGWDIGPASFVSLVVISALGFLLLTKHCTLIERTLLALGYFPFMFFVWLNLSFVIAARMGGGNP